MPHVVIDTESEVELFPMASSSSTSKDEIDTVLIFGLQIGVDWPTEPLMLPLVEKALYALPFLFEFSVDPETKAPYFYDRAHGKSMWNHPRRDEYRRLLKRLREEYKAGVDEMEALIEKYIPMIEIHVEEENDDLKTDKINLNQLDNLIMKGVKSGYTGRNKTLLVVDPTEIAVEHFRSDPNFQYIVLDARKMHFDRMSKRMRMYPILEEARRSLVQCMIKGKIFAVALGDICVDMLSTFNDHNQSEEDLPRSLPHERSIDTGIELAYLPSEFLLEAGDLLRESHWPERLYRRQDIALEFNVKPSMTHPNPKHYRVHDKFRVIVVSSLEKKQLTDALFNGSVGLPDSNNFEIVTLGEDTSMPGIDDMDKIGTLKKATNAVMAIRAMGGGAQFHTTTKE